MVKPCLMLCLAAGLCFGATVAGAQPQDTGAQSQGIRMPQGASLVVVPDAMPEPPFVGEMILVTVEGRYDGFINRQDLAIPPLAQFDWMQLGEESWSDERIDGRQLRMFRQRVALFPRKAGALVVAPFTHSLTRTNLRGERVDDAVTSPELVIDVRPAPVVEGGVFLPARALRVDDSWDPAPDRIPAGQSTVRTVRLEVEGLPPQSLPPTPPMQAGGLFSFKLPEQRESRLTPDGPVSSVTWRYEMQPQSDAPADLSDIPIHWFDTRARETRTHRLQAQEIAFEGKGGLTRKPAPLAQRLPLLGGLAGLLLGTALSIPALRRYGVAINWKYRPGLVFHRFALGLHLRFGNPAAARPHLVRVLQLRGQVGDDAPALHLLDRALYGRSPGLPPRRAIMRALRSPGRAGL